jgi:hypothetical protein
MDVEGDKRNNGDPNEHGSTRLQDRAHQRRPRRARTQTAGGLLPRSPERGKPRGVHYFDLPAIDRIRCAAEFVHPYGIPWYDSGPGETVFEPARRAFAH